MTKGPAVLLNEAVLLHHFRNGSAKNSICIFLTYAAAGATRTMIETCETHLINIENKA